VRVVDSPFGHWSYFQQQLTWTRSQSVFADNKGFLLYSILFYFCVQLVLSCHSWCVLSHSNPQVVTSLLTSEVASFTCLNHHLETLSQNKPQKFHHDVSDEQVTVYSHITLLRYQLCCTRDRSHCYK